MMKLTARYLPLAIVAASLALLPCALSPVAAKGKKAEPARSSKSEAASASSDVGAVKERLAAISKAASEGDSKLVGTLWTEDATYTDEDGKIAQGRDAIQKHFADAFALRGKQQLTLEPGTVKQLAPNVVTCEGIVQRQAGSTGAWPVSRFNMVLVKQGGQWLVSMATEAPVESARTNYDYLRQLSWLIGDWEAERQGASVHMKAEWRGNRNFIFCTYESKKPGQEVQIDTQLIGWDPRSQQPVSWSFDCTGGFGQGAWERRGDQWVVDVSGVQAGGNSTHSTNIIAKNEGGFSWQSTNRSVDGLALADTEPLAIRRVTR